MASWSPKELAALFQAWRESADMPLSERSKLSIQVYRRFSELVGDASLRSEAALAFKQGSLRNMAQLLLAFGDRDKWFGLSLEQKKRWFKMVNRMSYRFVDLDRETFDAVAELLEESQSEFAGIGMGSGLRVRLRRNSVDGDWEAQPLDSELIQSVEEAPEASNLLQPSRLQLQSPSAMQLQKRGAHTASTRLVKKFPFPSPSGDTRSIFAPPANGSRSIFAPSANGSRSIFAPAPRATISESLAKDLRAPTACTQDRLWASQRSGEAELAMNSFDSESSAESDSDDDMREESRAVAAHLKKLESDSSWGAPAAPSRKRDATQRSVVDSVKQRIAHVSLEATKHGKKRRRASLAAIHHSSSSLEEKPDGDDSRNASLEEQQQSNPELMMVANALEKQAQELKGLLAQAKEERALDMQQRERDARAKQARELEVQEILDSIGRSTNQLQHGNGDTFEEQKRMFANEIVCLREERRAFEQEREAEAETRRQVLAEIALDRDERVAFEVTRERDRAEREAYLALIEQDRRDRKQARETQERLVERIQLLVAECKRAEIGADGGFSTTKGQAYGSESSIARSSGDSVVELGDFCGEQENTRPNSNTSSSPRELFRVHEKDQPRLKLRGEREHLSL